MSSNSSAVKQRLIKCTVLQCGAVQQCSAQCYRFPDGSVLPLEAIPSAEELRSHGGRPLLTR